MKTVPFRTSFFYGWIIVFVSSLGLFFSGPGQTYSNSVFIESYITHLNMDRTTLSTIYAMATMLAGFLLFGVGKLMDRYGIRIMFTLVSLCLGLACFWNSYAAGPVTLFIGFFMVRLFGQGSLTLVPNTLVSQWFMKRRGRALSFAGLGGLLSAAAFPPLINWLVETYDWQTAWRVLGIMMIVVFTPIAYYFVRNRPEDAGMLPDGLPSVNGESDHAPQEISWTLQEAIRNRAFWFLLICTCIPAMLYTGITFQLFSIMNEREISRATTAFVLSLVPLVSFFCSLISGFVTERVKSNTLLGITFLLNIIAPLLLLMIHSIPMAVAFAIAWGIAQGFMNIPLRAIWPEYYGRQHLGSINSITTAVMVIGSALGPIPFGLMFDRLGSYDLVIVISMAIWIVGALLAFLSPQPTKKMDIPISNSI